MKKIVLLSYLLIHFISAKSQQTVGLFTKLPASLDGYVLFAPVRSDSTYLIDKCGKEVHKWISNYVPGLSAYLLADGSMLRAGEVANPVFTGNGSLGGVIEKFDWSGNLVWSYTISDSLQTQDHDICPMPNGNVLVAVWEKLNVTQAISAGRNPNLLGNAIWSAKLIELEPVGINQANIVWEWRLWDHLVQQYDSTKSNYGVVSDHPELLNLNYVIGNVSNPDWIHLNSVTYNQTLDQVMISSHSLCELWIIDHSTTTAQAAAHSGGMYGKGGDFLYRWGNPAAYNRGTVADKRLFQQHDPRWIPAGYKDENNIMIFNNGVGRPGGNYSSVDIIAPPVDSLGNYNINPGQPFAPANSYWSYEAFVPTSFYTAVMGGAERLSNGNTIICEATKGNLFEIDSNKNIVWRYVNPVGNAGPISQGTTTNKNGVFRYSLYQPNYIGFAGQTLTPGDPIELNPLSYICTMLTAIDDNILNTNPPFVIPNPFKDKILIHSNVDLKDVRARLTDITGRIIQTWNGVNFFSDQNETLELSHDMQGGIYFLNINASQFNFTFKLVQQEQ